MFRIIFITLPSVAISYKKVLYTGGFSKFFSLAISNDKGTLKRESVAKYQVHSAARYGNVSFTVNSAGNKRVPIWRWIHLIW
jgi:hypothetical protein